MMSRAPYRFLNNPLIYSICQNIVAPGHKHLLKKHFQTLFGTEQGLVLDVGCGPQLNTPRPGGTVYGVDINLDYVKQYTQGQNQAGIVCSAETIPFKNDIFDESRCFGLLHHLSRDNARKTVQEMIRCTKADGRVIILDNVWPRNPYLRPLAWLSRRLDRGQWVRHQEELQKLIQETYDGQWQLRRFTYTLIGQEALAFEIRKKQIKETINHG
jgi:SAM-dependent methyltransferase